MKKICITPVICMILATMFTSCFKVVKVGDEDKLVAAQTFDVSKNVSEFWQSQGVPELVKKAVPLTTILTESKGDLSALTKKYGKYSMGTSGELNYTVSGKAKIAEVHTEKKAGYMVLALDGYTGDTVIKMQIGTVYKGSSVRDSLDIINYDDYTNQVEWAAVSQNIHKEIQKTIIDQLQLDSLVNKSIEFVGCFTATSNSELVITPVQLTVSE